jgi:hypothetical protein
LFWSTTVPESPETLPPTAYVGLAAQVTATFVMSAAAIVPLPFATLQVWPLGFVLTVTL